MEENDVLELAAIWIVLIGLYKIINSDKWINRRWYVHPINKEKRKGEFYNLFQEIKLDEDKFFQYTRMTLTLFNKLLEMTYIHLLKLHSRAIPPEVKLTLTLKYLATGDQISSIAAAYRIGTSTARAIVHEVCDVLYEVLSPVYLRQPTENDYKNIILDFLELWNLPYCTGAIDGKHFTVQAPNNSGTWFFNYKKHFSIVLLAVCDAKYRFTLVQCGDMGSNSDAGIFTNSFIGVGLKNGELGMPKGTAILPGSNMRSSSFIVGDDAFPLLTNLMKPYPGRHLPEDRKIFNYRLSRARRTIENAFGILVARWRIFRRPIADKPVYADKIIMASICLHNFLMREEEALEVHERIYCPPTFIDSDRQEIQRNGTQRNEDQNVFRNFESQEYLPSSVDANIQRDTLKNYFLTSAGQVPWQWDYIRRSG